MTYWAYQGTQRDPCNFIRKGRLSFARLCVADELSIEDIGHKYDVIPLDGADVFQRGEIDSIGDQVALTQAPGDFARLPIDDARQDQVQAAAGVHLLQLAGVDPAAPPTLGKGRRGEARGPRGEFPRACSVGSSNWRGPIWMPVNAVLIRTVLSFYLYYGDNFKIECPTGSGKLINLFECPL